MPNKTKYGRLTLEQVAQAATFKLDLLDVTEPVSKQPTGFTVLDALTHPALWNKLAEVLLYDGAKAERRLSVAKSTEFFNKVFQLAYGDSTKPLKTLTIGEFRKGALAATRLRYSESNKEIIKLDGTLHKLSQESSKSPAELAKLEVQRNEVKAKREAAVNRREQTLQIFENNGWTKRQARRKKGKGENGSATDENDASGDSKSNKSTKSNRRKAKSSELKEGAEPKKFYVHGDVAQMKPALLGIGAKEDDSGLYFDDEAKRAEAQKLVAI